jgi:hypothetical protein
LISLSLSILSIFSSSNGQSECPFKDCDCRGDDFLLVNCDGNNNSSLPNRTSNDANLSTLIIRNYISERDQLPNNYLSNLTIKTLVIYNIGLRVINKNTFDGVKALEKLFIFQNNITNISVDAFSQIGSTITRLDLNENKITSELFASFVPALSYLRRLTDLNLSKNKIQRLAADAFVSLDSSLTSLNLTKNGIDDTAFIQMAPALSVLENLKSKI